MGFNPSGSGRNLTVNGFLDPKATTWALGRTLQLSIIW